MPPLPRETPEATSDQEPRFGRIHFNLGVSSWVVSLMFLCLFVATAFGEDGRPGLPPLAGWFFGAFTIILNLKVILRVPAVETNPEGIVLRDWSGRGRVFVRWEDADGVVVWHLRSGASRSTMVAVSTGDDFAYDNYGLYRPIRRIRNPPSGSKVKRRLRSWSVDIGKTSGWRIARLVNASGKGVPVVEELPDGDIWNHSGPQ